MKVNSKQLLEMIEKRELKSETYFIDRFGTKYKYFIDGYDLMNIICTIDNTNMELVDFINNEFEVLV